MEGKVEGKVEAKVRKGSGTYLAPGGLLLRQLCQEIRYPAFQVRQQYALHFVILAQRLVLYAQGLQQLLEVVHAGGGVRQHPGLERHDLGRKPR